MNVKRREMLIQRRSFDNNITRTAEEDLLLFTDLYMMY
jgi:hypothetical protein